MIKIVRTRKFTLGVKTHDVVFVLAHGEG